jgi:hypothetical protein
VQDPDSVGAHEKLPACGGADGAVGQRGAGNSVCGQGQPKKRRQKPVKKKPDNNVFFRLISALMADPFTTCLRLQV